MKKRTFEDLKPPEQGMVILIDAIIDGDYENVSVWVLKQEFDILIDASTLGEFDWELHNKKRKLRHVDVSAKPIWQMVQEISQKVPMEEWDKLPKDLATNYKHYLYGYPKLQENEKSQKHDRGKKV